MCIILPVSHIACTHTIAIWQHCIDATRYGQDGIKPCWNVKQHDQAVLTRRPCEDCSGQRFFSRRGGVADRGHGSPITPVLEVSTKTNDTFDDADDSGYHSDVIHEEDEPSDRDERPLSPKALAPRTKTCRRSKQPHRSLNRKPSWKPNLKRDLNLSLGYQPRRDSIDSLLSKLDDIDMRTIAYMETRQSSFEDLERVSTPPRQRRKSCDSTLLHPSTPAPEEMETAGHAQIAQAFPFPQVVDVRRSPRPALRARKNSTLLHPSSPTIPASDPGPRALRRRDSSLLHPSRPTDPQDFAYQQHRTILSVPPRRHTQSHSQSEQKNVRKQLQTTRSDPQSETMTRQRKASILHSALSDNEVEDENTPPSYPSSTIPGFACFNFTFAKRPANQYQAHSHSHTAPPSTTHNRSNTPTSQFETDTDSGNEFWNGIWQREDDEYAEEEMLRDSARVARESRDRRGKSRSDRVVREVVWTSIEGGGKQGRREKGGKPFWKC